MGENGFYCFVGENAGPVRGRVGVWGHSCIVECCLAAWGSLLGSAWWGLLKMISCVFCEGGGALGKFCRRFRGFCGGFWVFRGAFCVFCGLSVLYPCVFAQFVGKCRNLCTSFRVGRRVRLWVWPACVPRTFLVGRGCIWDKSAGEWKNMKDDGRFSFFYP